MKDINSINERIEELKRKKIELIRKQAESLFNKLQNIIGEKFSPELALSIVSNVWQQADEKQKESWQSSAPSFRNAKNNNTKQKTKKAKSAT